MPSGVRFADRIVGYPSLAGQIELRPETAIFRRFGSLNAENLLYLQAELTSLERELQLQQLGDHLSGNGGRSLSWYKLSTSDEDGDQHQLQLVYRIRELLRQYNEGLIQQAHILSYPKPDQRDLKFMQRFLESPMMGAPLHTTDGDIWGSLTDPKEHSPDLITLCPRPRVDVEVEPSSGANAVDQKFSKFIWSLKSRIGPERYGDLFDDAKSLRFTYWIASILASLIPIASITVLYCIHSMPARLAAISAFNVLVSVCLIAFTNAKRAEVFAITAAFAAVQVVFVTADNRS